MPEDYIGNDSGVGIAGRAGIVGALTENNPKLGVPILGAIISFSTNAAME